MTDTFSDEQLRTLINLRQHYEVWMDVERMIAALPYDLRRKEVGGRAYLYEIRDRSGNGKSLGPWSDALAAMFDDYRARKEEAYMRRDLIRPQLEETCRLYRTLRLPQLAAKAGPILREADRRRLLGTKLLVVGTNTMPAYAVEAARFLREAPDETLDLDLAWSATEAAGADQVLLPMLKAVDSRFTINTERSFQARDAKGYEVEILAAPSRIGTMGRTDRPKPIPLPEQEWLLLGTPVDHVVVCRDGLPARIVAPDPRWFALQKLWMAGQAKRNPLKRPKDAKQGNALLNAVWLAMPQYPLDAAFEESLPPELVAHYAAWLARPKPERVRHW